MITAMCDVCKEEIIGNNFWRREDNYKVIGLCCYDDYKDKDKLFDVIR